MAWLNEVTEALQAFIPTGTVLGRIIPDNLVKVTRCSTRTSCVWSWETSCKPIKDGPLVSKPDVVLRERPPFGPQPEFSWKDVISFVELTSTTYSNSSSTGTIRNSIMRKAYTIFASQPGRHFLFALSIASQDLHVHMFDRSGVVHSCPYNIHRSPQLLLCTLGVLAFGRAEQVGYDPTIVWFSPHPSRTALRRTIQVGSWICEIISLIFFNYLICGRGTSCWHVLYDGQDYVVKDSWAHESRVNCETDILNRIRGLEGVPQLVTAWIVEIEGSVDRTDTRRTSLPLDVGVHIHCRLLLQPVGLPLSEFKSIHELLSIFIDILDSTFEWPNLVFN